MSEAGKLMIPLNTSVYESFSSSLLQAIVTYICFLKMEQPSLPLRSSSISASQSSHEEVQSDYMKLEILHKPET